MQSIHTGKPVAGATISLLAVNGQLLAAQTTDADGLVHLPTLKGLEREKRPEPYVVKKDGDLSFLPFTGSDRKLDFSRLDVGGERNAENQAQLSAYLFSDRELYRPGDLFQVGITVARPQVSVDASGFTSLDYTPPDTAPTGAWTVNLYIVRNGKTDAQGHAEFDLDPKKYADATYQLYFQAKAYEAEGGRRVAANAQALVSNDDWLVGYRAVDDLGYVKRGSPRSVRLVAIEPHAQAIALKDRARSWSNCATCRCRRARIGAPTNTARA